MVKSTAKYFGGHNMQESDVDMPGGKFTLYPHPIPTAAAMIAPSTKYNTCSCRAHTNNITCGPLERYNEI